jgi:hypothetical protein
LFLQTIHHAFLHLGGVKVSTPTTWIGTISATRTIATCGGLSAVLGNANGGYDS